MLVTFTLSQYKTVKNHTGKLSHLVTLSGLVTASSITARDAESSMGWWGVLHVHCTVVDTVRILYCAGVHCFVWFIVLYCRVMQGCVFLSSNVYFGVMQDEVECSRCTLCRAVRCTREKIYAVYMDAQSEVQCKVPE